MNEGDSIELDGVTYTVNEAGDLVDEKGEVFKTKAELPKFLEEYSTEDSNEVPEIKQGIVLVKGVARDPGQRTKIAIYSEDPMVDAIGACVGNKGMRINAIVNELNGEKIDIIEFKEFLGNDCSQVNVILGKVLISFQVSDILSETG